MGETAAYVVAAVAAGSAAYSANEAGKQAKEQRRLGRLRLRRARNKAYGEQVRARAEANVLIAQQGAATSSAASTVPGSINTQGASNQAFLTDVSTITGNISTFQQRSNNAQAVGAIASQGYNFYRTGKKEGLFSGGSPKSGDISVAKGPE